MLELRKDIHQLEEQVKNANMQTHFKDNIIREMRNELKMARSKVCTDYFYFFIILFIDLPCLLVKHLIKVAPS